MSSGRDRMFDDWSTTKGTPPASGSAGNSTPWMVSLSTIARNLLSAGMFQSATGGRARQSGEVSTATSALQ